MSVGMPVYNGGQQFVRALDAVLAQTWTNLEILISDNASTDDTEAVCRAYAARDPRIVYTRNATDQGALENFRKVCLTSRGRYFFWAAHDDWWDPRFVKRMVAAFSAEPEGGVALSAVRRQYEDGEHRDILRFADAPGIRSRAWRILLLMFPAKRVRDRKYNVYMCGLFLGEPIRRVMREYSFIPGERPVVAAVVADRRFLYVDDVLMAKTVHRKTFSLRYTSDNYRKDKRALGRWGYAWASFRFLFATSAVSGRAKLTALPLAAGAVLAYLCCFQAKEWARRCIPEALWARLRGLKQRLLG
ncbi:glycosyltransferase family 2 protein [Desulfocurvus vexinensis]|uniref:glycosyltransferase family 2 protein n=1 Tax=Desulfocurvus vexinensis TaxID=399548 RepID=UPI00146FBB62|nr:glycosyltransferase family 2 protein [Desulfocurvus vexinensis]